jgi:hypothetical protein
MKKTVFLLIGIVSVATSCQSAPLGHSWFSGKAFLDANNNGQIDSADTPLKGAVFIARDARGAEYGNFTDADGSAIVQSIAPATYPVILRMNPPEGSNLVLIGPTEVVLKEESGSRAEFLFAKQPVTPLR